MASRTESVASYFFLDLIGSVIRFPLWWYGSGFFGVVQWVSRGLAYRWKAYDFLLWMKNFLVPMYGQHDWTGRLVSVVMRFFVLVWRLVAFLLEAFAYGLVLVFWLFAPAVFLLLFIFNVLQGAFASLPFLAN